MENVKNVRTLHSELFKVMHEFRRLNIGQMLPEGITHGELGILNLIYEHKPADDREGIIVSDIAAKMRAAPPAISRSLRNLESRGLILRRVDNKDRRNTYVALTDKGVSMVRECDGIMHGFADSVLNGLGEDNLRHLIAYMKEIFELSEKEIVQRRYKDRKEKADNEKNI